MKMALIAKELIRQFEKGEIINFSPREYAVLRRTSTKVLCEERFRGDGLKYIRVGKKVFYPCLGVLESLGVELSKEMGACNEPFDCL